jgi:predicted nucleic acid-binding protein
MSYYPDTSFLCALFRRQDNTTEAVTYRASMKEVLPVTALLLFEFRQSVRWQIFLHRKDAGKGYSEKEGTKMLADLQSDLSGGLLKIAEVEWARVISKAEELSGQHTSTGGYRGFDTLHVATALELGAREFLTFVARQGALAKAEGLKVRP